MKSNFTFLDTRILLVFVITFLLSASVLAYRATTSLPCNEVVFTTAENQYTEGELVKFIDATEGAEIWEWDFGDSTRTSSRTEPLHIYKTPGEYTVTLKVNQSCYLSKTIVINERQKLVDPENYPVFELPETIVLGETLMVTDQTQNATTWEWRFGETSAANATTQTATYDFTEPGLKTVSLIVNGNLENITKKKINVLQPQRKEVELTQLKKEKPKGWNIKYKPEQIPNEPTVTEKEKPIIVPFISDTEFERRLMMVSEDKMSAKDFTEYFCGDINKPVVANGDNTTFLVLCEQIRNKSIKIKSLNVFRNSGSNCIKTITVEYKKRWF